MTTFPFHIEDLDCWVHLEADFQDPGEVRYDSDGAPHIILREYDERVLLHECLHVIFAREKEARAVLGDREERIVRHMTRLLYVMGWRWKVTDRDIAQVERELNDTAFQRDELARELDGAQAPARDFEYRGEVA